MLGVMKTALGWNVSPTALGRRITAEIVDRVRSGAVAPVIGSTVGFEELPGLIDDMAQRRTTGRAIVMVD
jgi:NADPH:quinone reductase-like Zn-dependent oxidoreductase